jgi:tRNA pseudouridine55 synthase
MPRFQGRVQQRPPNFSAKKIGGVAAYKLARQQRAVELKPVEIEIFRFEILAVVGERATFVAEVSAGAYIRSLAHELGQLLGCGAHLSALRRARAGEFDLSQAVTLEQLGASFARREVELSECPLSDEAVGAESCCLMHPRQLLRALPNITATPEQLAGLRNGRPVNLPDFSSEPLVKVFANQSLLVAIAQRIAGTLFQPKVVLFGSNEPLPD